LLHLLSILCRLFRSPVSRVGTQDRPTVCCCCPPALAAFAHEAAGHLPASLEIRGYCRDRPTASSPCSSTVFARLFSPVGEKTEANVRLRRSLPLGTHRTLRVLRGRQSSSLFHFPKAVSGLWLSGVALEPNKRPDAQGRCSRRRCVIGQNITQAAVVHRALPSAASRFSLARVAAARMLRLNGGTEQSCQ
jgi:hypothetical protein